MHKLFFVLCVFIIFVMGAFVPNARADVFYEETLPLEVALIYYKLIDSPPNFEEMATFSPVYKKAPELGKNLILNEQKNLIENLYFGLDENQMISIIDNFNIYKAKTDLDTNGMNPRDVIANTSFELPAMTSKLHYIYDFGDNAYIIFVRNAAQFNTLSGLSIETVQDILSVIRNEIKIGAEIELKPVAADVKAFMKDGEPMRLILADIAMLRLIDNTNGAVLHEMTPIKRTDEEKSKMDVFFEEQLQLLQKKEEW